MTNCCYQIGAAEVAVATLLPMHSSGSGEESNASSLFVCLIKHNRCVNCTASKGVYLHYLIIHYSLCHLITWQNQYRKRHRKQRKRNLAFGIQLVTELQIGFKCRYSVREHGKDREQARTLVHKRVQT